METLGSILEIKTSNNSSIIPINEYYCDICDYNCGKRFNFDRHLLTPKHIKKVDKKHKLPIIANYCVCLYLIPLHLLS